MFKATAFLTLATIAGLALGFCREWLIIDHWGMSAETDALLVAMFLPEAIRMMLGSGLISSAALPLWTKLSHDVAGRWFNAQVNFSLLASLLLAGLLSLLAPVVVQLVGLGLSPPQVTLGKEIFLILVWSLPGMVLQSLLAVPLQAAHRYVLAGLGSFLFNLPPVLYLFIAAQPAFTTLAQSYVLGSVLMAVILLPYAVRSRLLTSLHLDLAATRNFLHQLWPLLTSSFASQGLTMLERICASFLGEGTITLVNFARKLTNLPLIALMSLNQVLLSKMSQALHEHRTTLLNTGILLTTLLTLPASLFFTGAAPSITKLTMPAGQDFAVLSILLACFSPSLLFGSWNALLARYYYAMGDTRTPLRIELTGSAMQALLMLTLPSIAGVYGLAFAVLGGVLLTAILLASKISHSVLKQLMLQSMVSGVLLGICFLLLFPLFRHHGLWVQSGLACLFASLVMLAYLWRLKQHFNQPAVT